MCTGKTKRGSHRSAASQACKKGGAGKIALYSTAKLYARKQ